MREAKEQQFTAIYETESDAIFRFCLVRVSDRNQALDLTQETFTRLWQSLADGKEMTNHRAFLFTVAHRLIIDWYRKKKAVSLEALYAASEEGGEAAEPADDGAYDSSGFSEEARFLMDRIKELGSSYRDAIYLRFVEGLPPPMIGEILGISANTASVRINRGLEELRRICGYDKNGDSLPRKNGSTISK